MSTDPFEPSRTHSAPETSDNTSIGALLRQLTQQVPELFAKELALAKAELLQNLGALKAGIAAVAGGAVVVMAGLVILLMAAVYALGTVMALWLAALIVGAITIIIGAALVQAGKKHFEPSHFTPDRTLNALQRDKDALKRKLP